MTSRLTIFWIILAVLGTAGVMQGCGHSQSTAQWVRLPQPESIGRTLYSACVHCEGCVPLEGLAQVTLMACECCNDMTISFQCRQTDKWFSMTINECDDIQWGTLK
jgi:hypothetical protein